MTDAQEAWQLTDEERRAWLDTAIWCNVHETDDYCHVDEYEEDDRG